MDTVEIIKAVVFGVVQGVSGLLHPPMQPATGQVVHRCSIVP